MQAPRGAAAQGASGSAHTVGLARKIWLNEAGTDLMMAPIEMLHELEKEVLINEKELTLEAANSLLGDVDEDMFYIRLTAEIDSATEFGINLKQGGKWDATTYTYDVAGETIKGRTENKGEGAGVSTVSGALPNTDGTISMEIYVDRSLVEAFFNDYKSISIRAYTDDPDSHAIDLFADGSVTIKSLYVASMGSIFEK